MRAVRLICAVILGVFLASSVRADMNSAKKDVAKYEQMYENETNPVKRAKVVVKLGRAEYKAARKAVDSEDWDSALAMLQDYSEKAAAAETALDHTGVNAEKHSNGFRQLQISVRESSQQLVEITSRMPFEQRGRFGSVMHKLDRLNQKLLLELFPHQPGHQTEAKEVQN